MRAEDITLESRRRIYRYIQENPGSHLRKIAREMNAKLGTLRYHLDYLEKKGLLSSRKEANLKTYFVTRKLSREDRKVSPLLQQKRFRDIILTVILEPDLSHGTLCSKLELKPSTLSKYLGILEERGVLTHERVGREKRYSVVDEAGIMELLLTYRKSFWDSFVDSVLEIYFEQ